MGTRSTIAVQHADGTVSQVYSHWDGYLDHNGKLLVAHYNTLELAEELVSLGDISSLGERIHPTAPLGIGHSFDKPEPGVTIYYGRDRGEDGVAPQKFPSLTGSQAGYMANGGGQEFDYIFFDGEWHVRCYVTEDIDTGYVGYVTVTAAMAMEKNHQEAE